jgi:hypothetical protein
VIWIAEIPDERTGADHIHLPYETEEEVVAWTHRVGGHLGEVSVRVASREKGCDACKRARSARRSIRSRSASSAAGSG